jgi:hypothetical protein
MKTYFSPEDIFYDGSQLKSLYGYLHHGILGDSIVGWLGGCEVPKSHMVDGEDLRANSVIKGSSMAHFIVEKFDVDLYAGVALQRLMTAIAIDVLKESAAGGPGATVATGLRRDGDDIFSGNRKLSISIATLSLASVLIHFAVNIKNEGTPVPTLSLEDLGVSPRAFAENFMTRVAAEADSILLATRKVRPVGSF